MLDSLAAARRHLYLVLGNLYLHGLTPQLLAHVKDLAVPELTGATPTPWCAQQAAVEHEELFGQAIPPYASLFMTEDGLLGGEMSQQVWLFYRRFDFAPPSGVGAPDHIGAQLLFMAHLSALESHATAQVNPTRSSLSETQFLFLSTYLLLWFGPFAVAVDCHTSDFFASLTSFTGRLLVEHAESLLCSTHTGDDDDPDTPSWQIPAISIPSPPPRLGEASTGLSDIAAHLLYPYRSGIFLSRQDLTRLARTQGLPIAFGTRREQLRQLLSTAGRFDCLQETLLAVREELDSWQVAYARLETDVLALKRFVRPWRRRLTDTQSWLAEFETLLCSQESQRQG